MLCHFQLSSNCALTNKNFITISNKFPIFLAAGQVPGKQIISKVIKIQCPLLKIIHTCQAKKRRRAKETKAWLPVESGAINLS